VQQPFAFAKLFTKSTQLTKLATVSMLHNMVDIKVTADPLLIFQQDTLGWSRIATQRFQVFPYVPHTSRILMTASCVFFLCDHILNLLLFYTDRPSWGLLFLLKAR
jgi:hypothetical protein